MDWKQIEQAFNHLAGIPGDRRQSELAALEQRDPALAAEVRELLENATHSRLTSAVSDVASDLMGSLGVIEEQQRIGAYRVTSRIAAGGMGVVYRAERADGQFRQQVAIKVLANRFASRDAAERFRVERQILARLDHPNIARLLDGGTVAGNVPYLVMEYIDGTPVTDYCDRERLTVSQRLTLFRKVCDAVQAAHSQLIVHRDIKPSNILVTAAGVPKLLDFGIAKLLDEEGEHTVVHTRAGHRMLTPAYASPEQLLGEPVTTATDVYALGGLLYTLLSGQPPRTQSAATSAATEAALAERAPVRPSTAVASGAAGEQPQTVALADARRTSPRELRRKLSGDLDNIIMMAMRREPARRYGTARQLSEDIARFQQRRPIEARAESLGYVVRMFLARNRFAVAAFSLTVVAIAALTGFYTSRLAVERDIAQAERDSARAVSTFMAQIFDAADPYARGQGKLLARDVLDAAAAQIDTELADQPRALADLLRSMGNAYRGLGLWDESEQMLQRSVRIEREYFGDSHEQLADTLAGLGSVLQRLKRPVEAEAAYRESARILEALYGLYHPGTLDVYAAVAGALRYQGKFEQALAQHAAAERVARALPEDEDAELSNVLMSTGLTHYAMGNYAAAEAAQRAAWEQASPILHEHHEQLFTILATLGMALHKQGRNTEAEAIYHDLLRRQAEALAPEHPMMGRGSRNLGLILAAAGKPAQAEQALLEATRIASIATGEHSPDALINMAHLARFYEDQGRTAEARVLYRRISSAPESTPSTATAIAKARQRIRDVDAGD